MPDTGGFTHLHVASGFSFKYGADTPAAVVEAARALGMDAVALTDRDGLYGAVKFVGACQRAGISPVLGVDLEVTPSGLLDGLPGWAVPRPRPATAPVRGGVSTDRKAPRVTVLALGADPRAGRPAGAGFSALCRLVSAAHSGERGRPVVSPADIARHLHGPDPQAPPRLVVMLGPASELGRAVHARRPDVASAVLRRWQELLGPRAVVVEVVCHHAPDPAPGSMSHAARSLQVAVAARARAVLTNAVRHVEPSRAPVLDVLDAARRLVPLSARHVDRANAEGHLKDPARMRRIAHDVAVAAGDPALGPSLLRHTDDLARACRLDPRADVGLGTVNLPEAEVLGLAPDASPDVVLHRRASAGLARCYPGASPTLFDQAHDRLQAELAVVSHLGFAAYFLTVTAVCDLVRDLGVRVSARGSGAGSLLNHLLGISAVDPLRHDLLMERFLSPARAHLPDIDLDVEAHRRTEVYDAVLGRFGTDRVAAVSMVETYRVRHAVRDVGAALGLPASEVDQIATAFPHLRASRARAAAAELPELRGTGLDSPRMDLFFHLVEGLDGLPRHVALHPCGVVLCHGGLRDLTPVERSLHGFPMSQFDKDDVEAVGLLKLDLLGVRMQSAMAHTLQEIARTSDAAPGTAGRHPGPGGPRPHDPVPVRADPPVPGAPDLDRVPFDDPTTFDLVRSTRTLGCFQIESPGQRELIGKFAPRTFEDVVVDISLFRPGPVASDMITPFLRVRQGAQEPRYLHEVLRPVLEETAGVVVFHEQVLRIVHLLTGCSLAQADEVRRALGAGPARDTVEAWFRARAAELGFEAGTVQEVWDVLAAFAAFGFCKAHAVAFAVPTYQSAWLKAHHPAAFFAGVLTHDPGMYPKRLILDDARSMGVAVLPVDVNRSGREYLVEDAPVPAPRRRAVRSWIDTAGEGQAVRVALTEVKGISDDEIGRVLRARPFTSLPDFWDRAGVSRPVTDNLVLAGAFDSLAARSVPPSPSGRAGPGRRDLLLQVSELDRWSRRGPARGGRARPASVVPTRGEPGAAPQLSLDLGADAGGGTTSSGLPGMTVDELVEAELDVLGLDVSGHVLDRYRPMLDELDLTWSQDLVEARNRQRVLVAGAKVATQTPPVRSGRRVVFLTLEDSTGPVDAALFDDVQDPHAATVFRSWLLVVQGVLRRVGPRGVSVRATAVWDLVGLWDLWCGAGTAAVVEHLAATGQRRGAPARSSPHRILVHPGGVRLSPYADVRPAGAAPARGGLWHTSQGSPGR